MNSQFQTLAVFLPTNLKDGTALAKMKMFQRDLFPQFAEVKLSQFVQYPLGLLAHETSREAIMNLKPVLHAILDDYALPIGGDHGVAHWARVLENGLRLAEETGANVEVVQLFAVLYDSCRINEVTDPEHGPRAAEFAVKIRGSVFDLDDHEFQLLYRSGQDSMGMHADNEPEMGNVIGSLSLGATRTFRIKHNKTKETMGFSLGHGSLIIMAGTMQQFWKHEPQMTKML